MVDVLAKFKNPVVAAILAFILGLVIGLVGLGWGLWPVNWTDAAARDLRPDAKVDYLRMVIDSYTLRKDMLQAKMRWDELNPGAQNILAGLLTEEAKGEKTNPEPKAINEFMTVIQAVPEVGEPVPLEEEENAPLVEKSSGLTWLMTIFSVVVLTGVVMAVAYFLRGVQRGRQRQSLREEDDFPPPVHMDEYDEESFSQVRSAAPPRAESRQSASASARPGPGMPQRQPAVSVSRPAVERQDELIAQYMTTYNVGDDLFDDSFAIDSPSGEFLGECGVGISETVGVGEPKKATALELWLFDKNDIQTVTRVLMSQYAANDSETYQRMLAKGEPVAVEAGMEVRMETATLALIARVVDMAYGSGPLPPKSYFERITLELTIKRIK